ncbi:hypothetical protein JHN52_29155 [Streptomyces sp. MBT97]|uniref:hypothetical protein n=1 Tax=Streptomyces sp. MBT97 TaxID=2800411 RepID=UPI00190B1A93|nr:hypothetical protein [Streptomyces sp. MBT97]MBK3636899.1 hypothetical protein [Streptomyces sp. MBT97]
MTALHVAPVNPQGRTALARVRDVMFGISFSFNVGLVAGIVHRLAEEKATFFDALGTGCTAGGWTAVFVLAVLAYVWNGQ